MWGGVEFHIDDDAKLNANYNHWWLQWCEEYVRMECIGAESFWWCLIVNGGWQIDEPDWSMPQVIVVILKFICRLMGKLIGK